MSTETKYSRDLTSSIPNDVLRWHLLGQESMRNRKLKIFDDVSNPSAELVLRLLELDVYEISCCGESILEYCEKNIQTHWYVLHFLREKYGTTSQPFSVSWSTYEKKLGYDPSFKDRISWIAAVDAPLGEKFVVVMKNDRSISSVIDFAELVEGHVSEKELSEEVKKSTNYLVRCGTVSGLLEIVGMPHLLTKLPALFTNNMAAEIIRYVPAEYGSVSPRAITFCERLIEHHSTLPNLDPSDNNWEMFQDVVESRCISLVRKFFEFVPIVSTKENVEVIRQAVLGMTGPTNWGIQELLVELTLPSSKLSCGVGNSFDVEDLRKIPDNNFLMLCDPGEVLSGVLENIVEYPNIRLEYNEWEVYIHAVRRRKKRLIEKMLRYTEVSSHPKVIYASFCEALEIGRNRRRRRSDKDEEKSMVVFLLSDETLQKKMKKEDKMLVLRLAEEGKKNEIAGMIKEWWKDL